MYFFLFPNHAKSAILKITYEVTYSVMQSDGKSFKINAFREAICGGAGEHHQGELETLTELTELI